MTVEFTDVLFPPNFHPSGEIKPIDDAIADGDWIGVMNLWLVRTNSNVIYQLRPPLGGWEPGKLDGSVGGYYRAGERKLDGLREAKEELGIEPSPHEVTHLGRHLSVGVDSMGRRRHLVVSVFMMICDMELSAFILDQKEVAAVFDIPADDVIEAFTYPSSQFSCVGIDCNGNELARSFASSDFSYIFGSYHKKIARIAKEFSKGERDLWY